LSEMLFVILQV